MITQRLVGIGIVVCALAQNAVFAKGPEPFDKLMACYKALPPFVSNYEGQFHTFDSKHLLMEGLKSKKRGMFLFGPGGSYFAPYSVPEKALADSGTITGAQCLEHRLPGDPDKPFFEIKTRSRYHQVPSRNRIAWEQPGTKKVCEERYGTAANGLKYQDDLNASYLAGFAENLAHNIAAFDLTEWGELGVAYQEMLKDMLRTGVPECKNTSFKRVTAAIEYKLEELREKTAKKTEPGDSEKEKDSSSATAR